MRGDVDRVAFVFAEEDEAAAHSKIPVDRQGCVQEILNGEADPYAAVEVDFKGIPYGEIDGLGREDVAGQVNRVERDGVAAVAGDRDGTGILHPVVVVDLDHGVVDPVPVRQDKGDIGDVHAIIVDAEQGVIGQRSNILVY